MRRIVALASMLAVVFVVLFLLYDRPSRIRPPDAWIGRWEGRCGVFAGDTRLPDLDIDVEVSPDGAVGGSLGDAELTDAIDQMKENARS